MSPVKLLLIIPLAIPGAAIAQGKTDRGVAPQPQSTAGRARTPVVTQPSNKPFFNPPGRCSGRICKQQPE